MAAPAPAPALPRLIDVARMLLESTTARLASFAQDGGITALLQTHTPIGFGIGHWIPLRQLGGGGFGVAAAWGYIDNNDNLVHRIAVKEAQCGGTSWHDPVAWTGLFTPQGNRNYCAGIVHLAHMEQDLHRRLHAQNPTSIVGFVGARINTRLWRYRVLMDYCPHGDLDDVIGFHQDRKHFATEEHDGRDTPIPEPFIWYVFQTLVKAAQLMHHGNEDGTVVPGWREIVHRDLKPGNIFLCDPPAAANADWKLYPSLVVGDFGLAIETSATDLNNPRAYTGVGTQGHFAAEMHDWVTFPNRHPFDREKLGSATNVWQIGAVIHCLVYRDMMPTVLTFDHDDVTTQVPQPRGRLPAEYSSTLTSLMKDCLEVEPSKRPSLTELAQRLDPPKSLDPDRLYFKGMRKLKPRPNLDWWDANQRGGMHRIGKSLRDRWAIGTARANLGN